MRSMLMSLKVVYLDDEPELCTLFEEMFSSGNVIIKTFVDANAAIDYVRINPPDIIFLDYRLRQTTGVQVAIKMDNLIPKILVTGDLTEEFSGDFFKVFHKPILSTQINELFMQLIQQQKITA